MSGQRRGVAVLCVVAVAWLSGCAGEATNAEKRLRAALRRTERVAHVFMYDEAFSDKDAARETVIRGLIEDDFRYKARVAIDGKPVLDEVVSDDALAVRLIEPLRLVDFLRRPQDRGRGSSGVGGVDEPNAPSAPTPVGNDDRPDPVAVLESRRWALDKAGAPAVFDSGAERRVGQDAVLDALDVFAYVDRAIDEALRVVEFDEEALQPVYKHKEDPFWRPKADSGVIRYDFDPPKLPKAADTSPGGNQITPDARHFRKMAVYVKDGMVVQIREVIDVESRLDDLSRIYETDFPEDRDPSEVAAIAVDALNAIRTGQGQDPIRLRTMSYKLKDIGEDIKVALPTEAVETSLALLQNRGRPADADAGAALASAVRSTPPTTAPPPSG